MSSMIALDRPVPTLPAAEPGPGLAPTGAPSHKRRTARKLWAGTLALSLLVSLSGSGSLFDSGIAFGLQARAAALHLRWADMKANGIPASDLAALEQEWAYTEHDKIFGAATAFWLPGGQAIVDRWEAAGEAVWSRDLNLYRASAVAADQSLHRALGVEPKVQRKARLEALSIATTPAELTTLSAEWNLESRLVPIDREIASMTGSLSTQAQQAGNMGIRSDPAQAVLARANEYSNLESLARMARAELLTRDLTSAQKSLQARLAAAAVTLKAFGHAADEINLASLYGIDLSGYQGRITTNRGAFANALAVAQFDAITTDLNQIAAAADGAVYVALSTTHVISGVTFYYQDHPLSCEEAATSMALTHQGIYLSQDQILAELGSDRRPMTVDSSGRVRWGNPYLTFVGNVNGSESNFTGYGTYYPPLVRIARAHGARIIAYGSMSAATIYARVIAGHPVVAFATWDWAWHPRRDYLSFDGQWIPFIGPAQASHVYTVVGVSPSSVLINDPIRGQYWISKSAFQAGYSDFNEAIVFA
jgi:uncharacterized protein YvpB